MSLLPDNLSFTIKGVQVVIGDTPENRASKKAWCKYCHKRCRVTRKFGSSNVCSHPACQLLAAEDD